MSSRRRPVVVLGMMSKHPVPGVVWQTVHYLLGFERLGYEAYYVEAGGHQPSAMLIGDNGRDEGDRSAEAAAFIGRMLWRFGLGDRWAFQALHSDGRCYGLDEGILARLWQRAELVVNLHGATRPREEFAAAGRLVYLETDPVQLQIELHRRRPSTLAFLAPHDAFFTFAENLGTDRCGLPITEEVPFRPTRQPVVCDLWDGGGEPGPAFTTIGNWEQRGRPVRFRGEVYHWSKHFEFLKFIDMPRRVAAPFELALSRTSLTPDQAEELDRHGWLVRDALEGVGDLDSYRAFIQRSRAEFTVAKDQNVRFRTGWFSDRSATYLAAGRPVITQETGFSDVLPTGEGLFGFSTGEEIVEAAGRILADYPRHSAAARALARECFDDRRVLGRLVADIGAARGPRAYALGAATEDLAGQAIDRLHVAIGKAQRQVSALRGRYERARTSEPAIAPARQRALRQARERLQRWRSVLERLEDRQDAMQTPATDRGDSRESA